MSLITREFGWSAYDLLLAVVKGLMQNKDQLQL